jgi:eukaryotic-like serine/threonine-protein kinase
MSLTAGTRLGPYEVLSHIDSGGMGDVYRARDTRLDREVALKVLPPGFSADADRIARFEREAKSIAALSHPNILAIFDTGTTGAPGHTTTYVVTELLEGQTLRGRLTDGPLPVRKAIDYAVQIARGLAAAHDKGLVHRDLKPENVFLLPDGQVKILDFGLARSVSAATVGSGATETIAAMTDPGTVMGTVGYMAPEQVRGHALDARSDLFAFGIVLHEMLSGQRAFQRETGAETMTAILKEDPPDLTGLRPDIAPALERIVRHCLEKSPTERFQSARDVAFALGALSGSASGATQSGASAIDTRTAPSRPRGALVLMAAAAATLIVGASAGYVARGTSGAAIASVSYSPVSFEDGFVFAARFAPDARTVVYSADWDGQERDIFVTSLDSREYRAIGIPGADLLGISRSGELAILSDSSVTGGNDYFRIGTMAKASLTGGAPRAELDGTLFADFGANGEMAVMRSDGTRQTMEFPVGQILAQVSTVRSRGRTPAAFATPRVSPSGNYVAFFDTQVTRAVRVRIFDRVGTFVAESRPFQDWWALAWTPTDEVWFAAAETAGWQTSIYSLDLSGRERTVLRAPGAITLHDISPQGDVLVSFDRGSRPLEVLGSTDSTSRSRSWREGSDTSAFSANHTLLITGNGDSAGPEGSVYAWPAQDTQPVRIAAGDGLALSPDGRYALVASKESPPTLSIVPTGAGRPSVVDIGPIEQASWAGWLPDGRLIVQVVRPGASAVAYTLSADGRDPNALLPDGVAFSAFSGNVIAPDGSRVIAVDADGAFVVCFVAKPECRPAPGIRDDEQVAGWSADNQSVFVWTQAPGRFEVDRVDVGSGRRSLWKTIRPLQPALSGLLGISAAPDGALAYSYRRSSAQLYVIKGLQ